MKYRVILIESDEGFSVSCPALKGCHSEGQSKEEALENIRIAIQEWLEIEKYIKGSIAQDAGLTPQEFKNLL